MLSPPETRPEGRKQMSGTSSVAVSADCITSQLYELHLQVIQYFGNVLAFQQTYAELVLVLVTGNLG